ELKRSLSSKVGPVYVNAVIDMALAVGALGAKVCGAGGGGFILVFADPSLHPRIIKELDLLHVPFRFETEGSKIVFHSQ
ncbi:MAG: kinase, partial [Chloroflexota bacterium]